MSDSALTLIESLIATLGEAHVRSPRLTGEAQDCSTYTTDWRKRHQGLPLAVVSPGSTTEVAAVMRLCAAHAQPVVVQGGNTGLVLGGVPDATGQEVVLSTRRLNHVREVDVANQTLTVEAGCLLADVQRAALDAGGFFPLSLASEGSCTIGGNLATNAGGTQVLAYGNARDLCLGLEVVTAQGEVWHGLSGLRKDNTGYDLRHLLVGSEGTLGIITAATLKLLPAPRIQHTAWVGVQGLDEAVALLNHLRSGLGNGLTAFEVMNPTALGLVAKHFGATVKLPMQGDWPIVALVEHSAHGVLQHGTSSTQGLGQASQPSAQNVTTPTPEANLLEAALAVALNEGLAGDAVLAHSLAQSQAMWQVRECIPLSQAQEGLNIKHDISLPLSKLAAFCVHTEALLKSRLPGVRLVNFGHLGDGNLHFNVQCPEGADGAAFLREHEAQVNTWVFDAVAQFGGSISAEHGIGALKAHTLPRYKDATALAMMRQIKSALDPQGLLGRGRVFARP